MNKDSRFFTILFTFIVSFTFVLVLSIINFGTLKRIEQNERLFQIKAILSAFGVQYRTDAEALRIYEERVRLETVNDMNIYRMSKNGEEMIAYIFVGSGLWGRIQGVIAFDKNLERVVGIDFIEQNETPGLGGRITEKAFKDQFKGKRIPQKGFSLRLGGGGDYDPESGRFDAITGATSTSRAVERIINDAIIQVRKAMGSGEND